MREFVETKVLKVQILGPVPALVYCIKNRWTQKIYLKAALSKDLHATYQAINRDQLHSNVYFTPNPVS